MRFAFIGAEKANWPVAAMCRALKVSRSGFYAARARSECNRTCEDKKLTVLTRAAHRKSRGTYGSPRLHRELRAHGVRISRKRVIRLMQAEGLRGKVRRRWVRTTNVDSTLPFAPNLLDRKFEADRPNQRWVADVTYLRTPEGWLYLAVVLDLFSRFIVGWALSAVNDRHLVLKALGQALRRRAPKPGLLHHTDRGSTYASEDYQKELQVRSITCSMSRRGNCYDNAAMESWFNTLKTELGEGFESADDAKRQLFEYIEIFYNQKRRHSTLGYVSPAEYERTAIEAGTVNKPVH